MSKHHEALKMALDSMETVTDVFLDTEGNYGTLEHNAIDAVYKSIDAIREAIAESEQEPVARVAEVHMSRYTIEWINGPLHEGALLYTHPAPSQRADTDELVKALAACRDAFAAPESGAHGEGEYDCAIADPLAVPAYVRAMASQQAFGKSDNIPHLTENILSDCGVSSRYEPLRAKCPVHGFGWCIDSFTRNCVLFKSKSQTIYTYLRVCGFQASQCTLPQRLHSSGLLFNKHKTRQELLDRLIQIGKRLPNCARKT